MNISRRNFTKNISAATLIAPWSFNLAALGNAAAQTATDSDDYKALVCVFLGGGNDYANTIVPTTAEEYEAYRQIRKGDWDETGGLAVPRRSLIALNASTSDNKTFGLAPSMSGMADLFNSGKMSVLFNVGTLLRPTNRLSFSAGREEVAYPSYLFSHVDQQNMWQSTSSGKTSTGWGAKLGDVYDSNNRLSVLTCIDMSTRALKFFKDPNFAPYSFSPWGTADFNANVEPLVSTLRDIYNPNNLENSFLGDGYSAMFNSTLSTLAEIKNNLQPENVIPNSTDYGAGSLALQLKMVTRIIASHKNFGLKRQVFIVYMPSFDQHNGLKTDHPLLLDRLSKGLAAFYKSTEALGLADRITTYTASDFGRTLVPNNDGSDHGWGSHHFIIGGAVNGKRYYGAAPSFDVKQGLEYIENSAGRLIPTTSVDQYGATLARWFGVTDEAVLQGIFPNLKNFATSDLKFMNV